jgi:hypothetical protein
MWLISLQNNDDNEAEFIDVFRILRQLVHMRQAAQESS